MLTDILKLLPSVACIVLAVWNYWSIRKRRNERILLEVENSALKHALEQVTAEKDIYELRLKRSEAENDMLAEAPDEVEMLATYRSLGVHAPSMEAIAAAQEAAKMKLFDDIMEDLDSL